MNIYATTLSGGKAGNTCPPVAYQHQVNSEVTVMRSIGRYEPNEFVDCGDYCELILYNVQGDENARVKVDHADIENLNQYRWFKMSSYAKSYSSAKVDGKRVLMHRFLMQVDEHIDHINGDGMDNRRSNLRTATQSQNMMNRKAERGDLVGVAKNGNRWQADIKVNGKKYYLGLYKTLAEAQAARQAGERILFGEYSWRKHDDCS